MSVRIGKVAHMEWIAPAVAVAAALIAGWQAWEARSARVDARKSASDARDHEERAVAASERIASAIEEQNERERAEREKYHNPWSVISTREKSSRTYKFRLGGDESLSDVSITMDEEHLAKEKFNFTKPTTEKMRPGESMSLGWWRHMGSALQISAEIHWTRPNGEKHHSVVTLD